MPVRQRDNKWYWGSKGPFDSRKKARKVARAAHASGYVAKLFAFTKAEEGIKGIKGVGDLIRTDPHWGDRPKDDVPKQFREYASPEEIKRLGLRPHHGIEEGTFYDTRDLKAGQYAAATGEKHTIDELEEAGGKGEITLDDLGIKLEDTPFSFRHIRDTSPEKVDLNFKHGGFQTQVQSKESDLLGTAEAHYNYSSGKARKWANAIHQNRNPVGGGELDSSKHKYVWDWMERAGDTEDEYAGTIRIEFERLLGRGVGDRELMSDLAPELRQSSERMVAKAQKELKQLGKIKDEIKAFKIQRGIDRIGLKRGESKKKPPTVTPRVGADTRFLELAAAQRGEAERLGTTAMSEVSGGGLRQFLTEAIGDVINRMSRQRPDDYSATVEKVKRGIRELSSKYGFTKDLEEQTRSSYDYGVEKGKITESFKAYKARILDIQSQYAVAHSKLPVINQAHRDAQAAAVAFGEQRYEDSLAALRRIESHLGSQEAFDAYRLKGAQPLSDKASKEVDKSLYKLGDDPLSKLLDFVILSKAPPFQVTPEGEVTPIKPIEGLGSQDSEREDYEGKEITTRKYIKDPEDAPEVNGEKVKVYTGPKVGHFYDYSQLSSTEHKDEFAQIVAEALDKLEQGVNEMVEANPELKDIFGVDPWVNIRRIEKLKIGVQAEIYRIAKAKVNKIFPQGTDTPASRLAFQRERTKVLDENPKFEEDYDKAMEKATEAYRGLLRNDKGNPYSETEQIEDAREHFGQLQDNYLTALIHSLQGKMDYHGGENHLPTNPNVEILSIQDSHQRYILPKVEGLAKQRSDQLFNTTDRRLLARFDKDWNTFIRRASPAALVAVKQIYSEVANQWLGVNVREKGIRSNVENGIAMSEATLTRGILPPNRGKGSKYTVRPEAIKDFRGTVIHELIHSGTSDEALEFLNNIIYDKTTWLDHVSRGVRGKFIPDIPFTNLKKRWGDGTNEQYFALVSQNNRQFFNEFPTEILAQRIASERYQPDAKDDGRRVDGEDWSKKKIGYSGHGIEQFSVWLLKFAQHDLKMSSREAKTPEGKAKIAKASRDICTELLDRQNMKENRRTVLSGSFASYARKHDNIHEYSDGSQTLPLREHYKNEFAYHVGVNPVAYPDLSRYKFSEAVIDDDGIQKPATIPTFSAKKTDEFGSGMDKRALRRIILG